MIQKVIDGPKYIVIGIIKSKDDRSAKKLKKIRFSLLDHATTFIEQCADTSSTMKNQLSGEGSRCNIADNSVLDEKIKIVPFSTKEDFYNHYRRYFEETGTCASRTTFYGAFRKQRAVR